MERLKFWKRNTGDSINNSYEDFCCEKGTEKNGVLNKRNVEFRAGFCLVSFLKMGDSAAYLYPDINSPVDKEKHAFEEKRDNC